MSNESTTDIIIDDGKKTYNIRNYNGDLLGSFRMNPADMSVLDRYSKVKENLQNIQQSIDSDKDIEEIYHDATELVKEQINYLFNCNCADEFFAITNPFSIMADGSYFLEMVINAILKVFKVDADIRIKKFESKISKHTRKYTK